MNPNRIIEIVCNAYLIAQWTLNYHSTKRSITEPRQVAQFFVYKLIHLSYTEIGKLIGGVERGTVMYSINTVENLIESDYKFRQRITEIDRNLQSIGFKSVLAPKLSMSTYPERKAMYLNLAK